MKRKEDTMVTVGMNYEVVAGKEKAFEKKFELVVEVLAATPSHVRTELFHSVKAPRSYLVVSEWQSEAAFEAFVTSDAFRKVTAWGESGILAARPRHQVYRGEAAPESAPSLKKCPFHVTANAAARLP